jgi:hypothetical protein
MRFVYAAALFTIPSLAWGQPPDQVSGPALTAANTDQSTEVLTRGPIHEAFAEVVNYNPQPGIVVAKQPPDPIAEVPPDEKPQGDNYVWVPG